MLDVLTVQFHSLSKPVDPKFMNFAEVFLKMNCKSSLNFSELPNNFILNKNYSSFSFSASFVLKG